jgi:hypothetical protein
LAALACVVRAQKKSDLSISLGGELLASEKFRNCWEAAGLTGVRFDYVENAVRRRCQGIYAMNVDVGAKVARSTIVADNPLSVGRSEYKPCSNGDTLGLALISQLGITSKSLQADATLTAQYFGVREGLLRPQSLLLFSRRAYSMFQAAQLSGCSFEVVDTGVDGE